MTVPHVRSGGHIFDVEKNVSLAYEINIVPVFICNTLVHLICYIVQKICF